MVEGPEHWVNELELYSEGSRNRNSIRLGLGAAVEKLVKPRSPEDPDDG